MAKFVLDHLIVGCSDLDQTGKQFSALFGVPFLPGGAHPGRGTRNLLGGLGEDVYLELLGPDFEQKNPSSMLSDMTEDTLVHWAVCTDDIETVASAIKEAGFHHDGVIDGARTQRDGSELRWKLLFINHSEAGAAMPFFIDWGESCHPSSTLPSVGGVSNFIIETPQADRLNDLFVQLGGAFNVVCAAEPRLKAELQTPNGLVALESGTPFPKGLTVLKRQLLST